ncbi:MAG: hypothetical protein WC915_02630 [archaeon]|jgi:hypothetical protein
MVENTIWKPFLELRRRNKILFTVIVSLAIVVFWKGAWGLADIVFDVWLFRDHLFWSNVAAILIGFIVLSASGLALEKLA